MHRINYGISAGPMEHVVSGNQLSRQEILPYWNKNSGEVSDD